MVDFFDIFSQPEIYIYEFVCIHLFIKFKQEMFICFIKLPHALDLWVAKDPSECILEFIMEHIFPPRSREMAALQIFGLLLLSTLASLAIGMGLTAALLSPKIFEPRYI